MEEKIVIVLNEMSEYLSITQMKKLQEVIIKTFADNEAIHSRFVNMLPNLSCTNLVEEKDNYNAHCVFSTYQTKSDIAISVVIENNNLVISVSDDGCGFKNIEIEKATLPFYKSSKDISTEHLGLGLNISKILSERHGGNIQIANNKAGGACVTVKINCNES